MNIERPKHGYYNTSNWINPSAAEHQERYSFAARHISMINNLANLNCVGDMSCGYGESTHFLQKQLVLNGKKVISLVGVDIDESSINHAIRNKKSTQTFVCKDISTLDFPCDLGKLGFQNFDAITCLETVEHVSPAENATVSLKNLNFLLQNKNGILIVSSPNRRYFANNRYKPYSPFHIQELNLTEFSEILDRTGFKYDIYGQRIMPVNFIRMFDGLRTVADKHIKYRRQIGKVITVLSNLGNIDPRVKKWEDTVKVQPKYFVAVCRIR
ncbi:MAG: methyltransferase domain-containing protein [bacterium]|nr:MAG: methyltransferase domain-containing protein [bacterium]